MKNEKGITLIALIITIIVMLILVGVTINVALNGGLFEKAKDATTETSREVSREQIVAAMIGAYDNNGNFIKANVELPEETKWCLKDENYSNASGEGNYVVTKNNEKFYVNPTDGTVLDEEPQEQLGEMDDLIPTSEQIAEAEVLETGTYGFDDEGNIAYTSMGTIKIVDLYYNNVEYVWFCNEDSAQEFNAPKSCTWYNKDTGEEYTGPCPIAFTEQQLQNNSYLNRIYNSFNNN